MSNISNTNTIDDDHPLSLFLSMLGSPESKRQYPKRLQHFFHFLKLEGDIQDQALSFVKEYKNKDDDGEELERRLLTFARFQQERVAKKEVSPSTVPNYFKAIKLFCQANRISKNIEWKNVTKAMPRGVNASDDRAPTLEEIQKLLEFPDRRIKPLVLTLVSSGIRIGAFETLKWKHITPKYDQKTNDIIAAKIHVYAGDKEQYHSFLTPEAYTALKEWMNYRADCGESITGNSLVMRDIWQVDDTEGAANPKPLTAFAITRLLNRAWQAQKIRPKLQQGEKRHEFKTAHGFRKYFKVQTEQARIPSIKIEMLMGHSLGVTDSYAKFTEEQMLDDYIKTIDYLTVNQTVVLINKSLKKQEETIQNSLRDMEERHKKEIELLKEKHNNQIVEINEQVKDIYNALDVNNALKQTKIMGENSKKMYAHTKSIFESYFKVILSLNDFIKSNPELKPSIEVLLHKRGIKGLLSSDKIRELLNHHEEHQKEIAQIEKEMDESLNNLEYSQN